MGIRLKVTREKRENDAASPEGKELDTSFVFSFDQSRVVIGRGQNSDVQLPSRTVSQKHATLEVEGSRVLVIDHQSANGTWIERKRIAPGAPRALRSGESMRIGEFVVALEMLPITESMSAEKTHQLARLMLASLHQEFQKPKASLLVQNGALAGQILPLPPAPARLVIGRDEGCALRFDDRDMSREHAEIEVSEHHIWLRDLGSKNGIRVGDRLCTEKKLRHGDVLRVGSTQMVFEDATSAHLNELSQNPHDESHATTLPEMPSVALDVSRLDRSALDLPSFDASEDQDFQDQIDEQMDDAEGPQQASSETPQAKRKVLLPNSNAAQSNAVKPEVVVILIGLLVIALSAAGIYWLLRSGS